MSIGFALHLLRHGEPAGAGQLIGHTDAAPLPAGIALCTGRARGLAASAIVTSDLDRAQRAALAIAAERDMPCTVDPRWRELNFGAWEGLDPDSVPPGAMARFWADPDTAPPPGGERWSALCDRVALALAELDGTTLVVTHAGAIRAALSRLLALDHRQSWGIALPYGALVSLHVWPGTAPRAHITGVVT